MRRIARYEAAACAADIQAGFAPTTLPQHGNSPEAARLAPLPEAAEPLRPYLRACQPGRERWREAEEPLLALEVSMPALFAAEARKAQRERPEHTLPGEEALTRVLRYGAHLDRQLACAPKQRQRLQAERRAAASVAPPPPVAPVAAEEAPVRGPGLASFGNAELASPVGVAEAAVHRIAALLGERWAERVPALDLASFGRKGPALSALRPQRNGHGPAEGQPRTDRGPNNGP